jgi:hypothetical protein
MWISLKILKLLFPKHALRICTHYIILQGQHGSNNFNSLGTGFKAQSFLRKKKTKKKKKKRRLYNYIILHSRVFKLPNFSGIVAKHLNKDYYQKQNDL